MAFCNCPQSSGKLVFPPLRRFEYRTETVQTLDDVDFTVLAATSVLGDLIDKCPPAEACRDAFERMSKATVHMCLSTTGFGSRAPLLGLPKMKHSRSSSSQSQPPGFVQAQNDQGYFRPQRPRPQFDMNLKDLFPEETQETRNFARNIGHWQYPHQVQQIHPAPQLTPQNTMYSDMGSSPSAAPAQLYQGQRRQQQQQPQQMSQHTSPYLQTYNLPANNMMPMAQQAGQGGYDIYGFNSDIDSLLAESTAQYTGQPGYSLGFDSEHDWSEGGGADLFDGFFFGGAAAAGSYSASGAGLGTMNL